MIAGLQRACNAQVAATRNNAALRAVMVTLAPVAMVDGLHCEDASGGGLPAHDAKLLEAWPSNHLIRRRPRCRPGTCIARPTKLYGSAPSRRPTNATLSRRWQRSGICRPTG